MKKNGFLLLFLFQATCIWAQNSDILQFVNPFVGTDGHGHTYPGATTPFGMVQLSPDTRPNPSDWDGCSGYHYTDTALYGFSHTHLSGTGVADYCDVSIMPLLSDTYETNSAFPFYKKWEKAEAGYYKVQLKNGIKAQLTATPHVGVHQYDFGTKQSRNLAINLVFRDQVLAAELQIVGKNAVAGYRKSKGWAAEQTVYFYIEFSERFTKTKNLFTQKTQGDSVVSVFSFKKNTSKPLVVKVGISGVSIAGAKANMRAEATHFNFEQYKNEAQKQWTTELEKIQVEGGTMQQLTSFYTAIYHSYVAPNLFSDADGAYTGTDMQPHPAQKSATYTVFSLWDTYRAAHPLYTITQPERTCGFVQSFLQQYKNSGLLPVWELAANETNCMIGYHAVPVIVDAYLKGFGCFDAELAYQACVASAEQNTTEKNAYKQYGFIASNQASESVSKTLEYAYDDWCIAQFAKALGKNNDYEKYLKRSFGYQNLFDPETKMMRPKANQLFKTPFDAREVDFNFTEANSWQYSFYVPQNVPHLVAMHGGAQNFERKLDTLFAQNTQTLGRTQADITGLIGQYAHGNEPSHHIAYLYNYTDSPHKTQEITRKITQKLYTNLPDGLCGNEDCGQMSAWFVFTALGFYPLNPACGGYELGSPMFKEAKINLPNQKTFRVSAPNNSAKNKYVKQCTLNGKPIQNHQLLHQEIMRGGVLVFEMDSVPPPATTQEPTEETQATAPISAPFLRAKSHTFTDSVVVTVQHISPEARILMNEKSYKTGEKLTLKNTQMLEIRAILGVDSSAKLQANFVKLNNERKATCLQKYNSQYTAGGDNGIVDGLRGNADFRLGGWQGYQYKDFEAVIDLGKTKEIYKVGAGFLQDTRSWIWFPTQLTFWGSDDGTSFKKIEDIAISEDPQSPDVRTKYFGKQIEPVFFRYLKVRAKNFGDIPSWHPGAGDGAFIFIDEILLNDEK